jgi:hypothetical protein
MILSLHEIVPEAPCAWITEIALGTGAIKIDDPAD